MSDFETVAVGTMDELKTLRRRLAASVHPIGTLHWAMDHSIAVRAVVALLAIETGLLIGLLAR